MANPSKSSSKHEYNKPRLKEQIDAAMAAFIRAGHSVQHVPTVVAPEPPPSVHVEGKLPDTPK
ncbi:MAG: hypothetical protein EOO38_08680 [Cytophagaceae bacterium]|nr:MAG: hypothetical protein EOO38_08680 [Cytophagaceae bacterium]